MGLPRIFFSGINCFIYFKSSKPFPLSRLAANLRYFENKLREKYVLKSTHCFFQHAIRQDDIWGENTDEHMNINVTCLPIAHNLQIKMKSARSPSHNKSRI